VVFHADREMHRAGFTTLRFNFRGAGSSTGSHDAGRGEVDDLGAAARWLRGLAPGVPLVAAGFSFGAWCGLRYALHDPAVRAVVAIGLPVRVYPLGEEIRALGRPLAVVQAGNDEFGTPDEVASLLDAARAPSRLVVVEGTGHLFAPRARRAGEEAAAAAAWCLSAL
jgi:hypothetical protein